MMKTRFAATFIILGLAFIWSGTVYDMADRTATHSHDIPTENHERNDEMSGVTDSVNARLAIIIDDMGRSEVAFDRLCALGVPITLAFLPGLEFSERQSAEASRNGFDVLLHLPMEPNSPEIDPGEHAVRCSMTSDQISRTILTALELVPFAVGVDNHMGSKATSDSRVMAATLETIKRQGLFFIDSFTSGDSVAFRMAKTMGIPTARNDYFIDNSRDVGRIIEYIRMAARKAKARGTAVVIGHPHPETIDAIERVIPELRAEGVKLVFASEILR